jgi:hypothetical protein
MGIPGKIQSFNPRARTGRDPGNYWHLLPQQFQSTRPHGARLLLCNFLKSFFFKGKICDPAPLLLRSINFSKNPTANWLLFLIKLKLRTPPLSIPHNPLISQFKKPNLKLRGSGSHSPLHHQGIIRVIPFFRPDMLHPFSPVSPEKIEPKTVGLRVNFL